MQLARLAPSPRPGAVARRPRGAPVAAKPTKAADFRGLEADALDAAVAESRRALFDLRIAQRTRQVRVVGVARGGGGVARRGAAAAAGAPRANAASAPPAPLAARAFHARGPGGRGNAGPEGRSGRWRRSGRPARSAGALTRPLPVSPRNSSRPTLAGTRPRCGGGQWGGMAGRGRGRAPAADRPTPILSSLPHPTPDRPAPHHQAGAHPGRRRGQARRAQGGEEGEGRRWVRPILRKGRARGRPLRPGAMSFCLFAVPPGACVGVRGGAL